MSKPLRRRRARLDTVEGLHTWLAQLCGERDSNFFLTNNDMGDELTVLMDYPVAAISFMWASDRLSFSASTDPAFEVVSDQDCHESSVGDTPTPVPMDRCIPFDLMQKVVEYIFVNGSLPDWIAWRRPQAGGPRREGAGQRGPA